MDQGDIMNRNGGWFHRLGAKISAGTRSFMAGRYGTDKLNMVILVAGLIACLLAMFIDAPAVNLILILLSYALMGWAIFRALSRNTYKRYQENRRYLMIFQKLKDREHRYYSCPRCHQSVRVPRGKGKISISCPKCKEKFIRKT